MLRKTLAIAAILDVSIAVALSFEAADHRPQVESRRVVDARMLERINGTYVDEAWPGECDVAILNRSVARGAPRAITIAYSSGLMTLRAAPPQSLRLLHVQTRPQQTDTWPVRFRNGLGHWENGDVIIESLAPALPLWSMQIAPRNSTLRERLSFSTTSLTYRASYRSAGEDEGEPFEVTLTKCDVSNVN